jgi:hypothetical protein
MSQTGSPYVKPAGGSTLSDTVLIARNSLHRVGWGHVSIVYHPTEICRS